MCGIAGVVWQDSTRPVAPALLEAMTNQLAHRGPDGAGFEYFPGAALGHRRLSIIDLAGGRQPLANEDQTVWVTFNGEIYNFADLTNDLLARGHVFRTRSDTEVLVHLYEEYGAAMVAKLRGMFAFVVWDTRRGVLLLARDRLGKKPLVYWHDHEGLRFASELKALLVEPNCPRQLDPRALDEYLTYQYIPHPRTIFSGIQKLPPGHYALWENGKLTVERYWYADYSREVVRDEGEYRERLRATLRHAVQLRMISDVPLGAFLSGGIDSTIIVGLMREVANAPVKTFSIGFPVREYDESNFARTAARHLGTDHEEFMVEPDAVGLVKQLSWFYDEPFADSSAVPTWYVSRLSRQHVTVALTGDAGDELFAGYDRYRAAQLGIWFDRLPKPLRALVACSCWQRLPAPGRQKSWWRRVRKLLRLLQLSPHERYRNLIMIFDDAWRARLYHPEFAARLQQEHVKPDAWFQRLYAMFPERDFLSQTTYVDLESYLPCDILTKVDIASMANSLECRAPFLDHEVVALAAQMPMALKIRGAQSKYILKETFADFLPKKLRDRPKMGFGVPLDHWFRGPLVPLLHDVLLAESSLARGWFLPQSVRQLVDEHLSRRWDHSARLWALLMLELWARNFLDNTCHTSV